MVKLKYLFLEAFAVICLLTGCSKVSPTGLLITGSSVEDRVKQSQFYWTNDTVRGYSGYYYNETNDGDYYYLLGSDPHVVDSLGRIREFFSLMVNDSLVKTHTEPYLFCSILGDIIDSQPEYFSKVDWLLSSFKTKYQAAYNKELKFYTIVGNHDITHNGWTMFYSLFGGSTYIVPIIFTDSSGNPQYDLHIFLDSACATLGKRQYDDFLIPMLDELGKSGKACRHIMIYTHNPLFRSRLGSYSSNFPREEYYRLIDTFANYKVDYVFTGHLHCPGYYEWRGVKYKLLDCFGERNHPEKGEVYSVHCKSNGEIEINNIYLK
jgi:hypothetical protein